MGEAVAVDGGGSAPSVQIIFSAIDREKEGHCALPPKEREGLHTKVIMSMVRRYEREKHY